MTNDSPSPLPPTSPELDALEAASPPGPSLIRAEQTQTLVQITNLPTAAGREWRVVEYIKQWTDARPDLRLTTDAAGNLVIAFAELPRQLDTPPLFITAHLDHPAFVIERIDEPAAQLELSFRGGVMDVFFDHAPIVAYTRRDEPLHATLLAKLDRATPAGQHYLAEVHLDDDPRAPRLRDLAIGDVATWLLDPSEVDAQGVLHAPACDDLAALAAALSAMDQLRVARSAGEPVGDVRLLFTRAEEIGFVGAIAACKLATIPAGSTILALENSRAFAESPVGGGPIVRVGDRLSTFTPWLTAACASRAEELFGGPSTPLASQRNGQHNQRAWQRKLMAGGACEASVFCHWGYDATCLCLPLGNYHNMPHLDLLQAGRYDASTLGPPRAAREFIHTHDYFGLVDLLVALGLRGVRPSDQEHARARFDRLHADKGYVLG